MSVTALIDSPRSVLSKPKLNDFHREFIAAYEQCPVLWDPKHVHYSNQIERSNAYNVLVQILRKVDPGATQECVKKQINSLRSNYRRLLRRHLSSKVIIDGEEVYRFIPTSWKFYAMRFLDNIENNNSKEENISMVQTSDQENQEVEEEGIDNGNFEAVKYDDPQLLNFKPKKRKSSMHSLLDDSQWQQYECVDVREITAQEFEAIGSNVSYKLRRMGDDQRHIAELLINKVLINGLRNALCDESDLTGLILTQPCE